VLPRQFGPYLLHELIGVGGMGEVHRAMDTRRDRWVALKLLPLALGGDEEYLTRFRRESLLAARLRDPHVVPIHDFGEIEGRLFLDMRLVDGEDLGTLLAREGAQPPGRAVHLVGQLAEALDEAHAQGLVHRDVKPSNALVTRSDFLYVVDFGIARPVGTTGSSLTLTGVTVGTLDYMAPERFTNRPVDARTDVYSLACLLHEVLTGRRPFPGQDLPSLMYAHLSAPPPRAGEHQPGVPPALDEVVVRGMAKDPAERFPSAGALAAAAREAIAPTAVHLLPRAVPGATGPVSGAGEGPGPAGTPAVVVAAPRRPDDDGPAAGATVVRPAQAPAAPPTGPAAPRRRGRRLLPALVAAVLVAGGGTAAALVWAPWDRDPAVAAALTQPAVAATPAVGSTPGDVALSPDGRTAWVARRDAAALAEVDTGSGRVLATVPVPAGPAWYVAMAPDGRRVYVSVKDAGFAVSRIAVVDTATRQVVGGVDVGRRPFDGALSPDGRRLYVTAHDAGRVDVVDTASLRVVGSLPVPPTPRSVALAPDGSRAYVVDDTTSALTVVGTADGRVQATVPVGRTPCDVAVSPDGARVAVAGYDAGVVTLVDPAAGRVVATVRVGVHPQAVAWSRDGRLVYAVDAGTDDVSVVDAGAARVTATVPAGAGPTNIAVSRDGRRAYVADAGGGTLTVLTTG
jgi:serine/threonine-protein kinase